MKVHELIEILSNWNPDHEVILAKDGEGNSFSPCAAYGVGQYVPDSTWSGELRSEEVTKGDGGCKPKEVNAVVLWPTN